MTLSRTVLPLLALALCACGTSRVTYEPIDEETMMAKMMVAGTPTAPHEDLASLTGSWSCEMVMWMEPDGEGMTIPATSEIEMILGGRYMMEHFSADFMGMPFEGRLLMTYDNTLEEYVSVWMDNMSTSMLMQRGPVDEDGTVHMAGMARDSMTPAGRPLRTVSTTVDENTRIFEMFDTYHDGSEYQTMKITYHRDEG